MANKETSTAERGNKYALTASGKKALEGVEGQQAVIRDALLKGPLTAAEIVAKHGKKMKTKSAAKNVAFYLSTWKSDGLVKFA